MDYKVGVGIKPFCRRKNAVYNSILLFVLTLAVGKMKECNLV